MLARQHDDLRANTAAADRAEPGGSDERSNSEAVGPANCARSVQPTFASFDPAAFQGGDVTLGAWRRTASFLEAEEWSRSRSALEEAFSDLRCCVPSATGRSPAWGWCLKRVGSRAHVGLVGFFVFFEALRFVVAEHVEVEGVNTASIAVVANLVSLVVALFLSLVLQGCTVLRKITSCRPLWRFASVALLFAGASASTLVARRTGESPAQIETLGCVYLPISAVLSYLAFARRYGKLEWLAMGMLTLAVVTFILLREQYKGALLSGTRRVHIKYTLVGCALVLLSVVLSVSASILAERIFKDRSRGLKRWSAEFYVMKVHIDFSSLVISVLLWLAPSPSARTSGILGAIFEQGVDEGVWFGDWRWQQYVTVFARVGHGWAAGLLVKEFSTVTRAIVTTLTIVLVMCVEDPVMGNRFHFQAREVPSISLGIVIFLSALIFQTGRLNLKDIERSAGRREWSSDTLHLPSEASLEEEPDLEGDGAKPGGHERADTAAAACADAKASGEGGQAAALAAGCWQTWQPVATTYALVLVYILSDALRNLTLQKAMSSTVINSNSMCLMQYVCGATVASLITLWKDGLHGLRTAWSPRRVARCLPAGFLFALSTVLMNMAYSRGMSAAIALVLGKFYVLVAAIGARFLLGKFYMWLEYVAIAILTLASATFGYLQASDVETGDPSMASLAAMLLVLGSAAAAAFNSLITERILKREQAAFHLQKVHLDVASALCSLALVPVIGLLTSQPQEIPWMERPVSGACPRSSVCWDASADMCANVRCECECASGLFAGWTSSSKAVILLALVINTVYSWLVGKLVLAFSTIHRAVADSFSLLVVYFAADPLLNGASLGNACLNMVAFIVPLSTGLFTVAASEMRKVMRAVEDGKRPLSPDLSLQPCGTPRSGEPHADEEGACANAAGAVGAVAVDAASVDADEFPPAEAVAERDDVQIATQEAQSATSCRADPLAPEAMTT